MTRGYIHNLDKAIYQNKGELLDMYDGCLLDNRLYRTKRGYMAIYEEYVNCWTSRYSFEFSADEQEMLDMYNRFYDNMDVAMEGFEL